MKRGMFAIAGASLIVMASASMLGQEGQMPRAGPEHKRLEFFVGN